MKKHFLFFALIFAGYFSFSQYAPLVSATVSGNSFLCAFSEGTYSIAPVTGAAAYTWSFPFTWQGSSKTNTINIIPNLNSGTITVTTTNNNGQIIIGRFAINVIDCNTEINKFGLSGFEGLLNVSPNPNYGKIFIDYQNDRSQLTVTILNLLGEEVYRGLLFQNTKKEIKLPGLIGLYFLKVSAPNNYLLFQKKLIFE